MESTSNGDENPPLDWGETIERPKEDIEFTFNFSIHQNQCVLRIPITLPLKESVRELMYRVIASHNVPCYIHNGKKSYFKSENFRVFFFWHSYIVM